MPRHKKSACTPWSPLACNTPSYRAVWVYLCFPAVSKAAPQLTVCLQVDAGACGRLPEARGTRATGICGRWVTVTDPCLPAPSAQDGPELLLPLWPSRAAPHGANPPTEVDGGGERLAAEEWSQDHGKLIVDEVIVSHGSASADRVSRTTAHACQGRQREQSHKREPPLHSN